MPPEFNIDWSLFQSVIISLSLGAIVGLERQSHADEEGVTEASGIRTFALSSLLGTVVALSTEVAEALPYVLGFGYLVLLLSHHVVELRQSEEPQGITTEIAALLVFVLGAMVPHRPILAASIAVVVALVLAVKRYVHGAVEKLSREELYGTLKFLLVTVVFLPLLPDQFVDPWGIYNPQELWFLVILISGISFVGYFAMRFLGTSRGLAVTGALGGLASSTAVTLSMTANVARAPDDATSIRRAATFAIVMANTIMFGRLLIEVAAANSTLFDDAALGLGAMAAVGLATSAVLWVWMGRSEGEPEEADADGESLELDNPFRLMPALKFGLVFVVIIGGVHLANEAFGDQGMYIAAMISGLADADATSLTAARMEATGDLTVTAAVRTILIAAISNTLVKAGIGAVLGSVRFGLTILIAVLPTAVIGTAFAIWLI